MSDYFFTTRQLTVGYDGVPLIRDITLHVDRGEIVTLVGPNGSGKSTILKSITRQLRALGGQVFVASEELRAISRRDLATKVAVVLTDRVRPELMTCRDIVAMGRYPYTGRLGRLSGADAAKVDEAMAAVRALDIAERDFNTLSDGQRQRVLLARALCQEPELLVLDEPTSFLDLRHKLQLLDILRDMAKRRGIAVILSLHEIDLAQKLSDRIVFVKGDTIDRVGPPARVFTEQAVRDLYDLDRGSYDPLFGSVELAPPAGEPRTLVLSACGTGIPVYRALQQAGEPFVAGILYTNDVDWRLARRLASEVVEERPFMPIGDAAFERALYWIERCDRIIDAGVALGETNRRMAEVVAAARRKEGYEEAKSC